MLDGIVPLESKAAGSCATYHKGTHAGVVPRGWSSDSDHLHKEASLLTSCRWSRKEGAC